MNKSTLGTSIFRSKYFLIYILLNTFLDSSSENLENQNGSIKQSKSDEKGTSLLLFNLSSLKMYTDLVTCNGIIIFLSGVHKRDRLL